MAVALPARALRDGLAARDPAKKATDQRRHLPRLPSLGATRGRPVQQSTSTSRLRLLSAVFATLHLPINYPLSNACPLPAEDDHEIASRCLEVRTLSHTSVFSTSQYINDTAPRRIPPSNASRSYTGCSCDSLFWFWFSLFGCACHVTSLHVASRQVGSRWAQRSPARRKQYTSGHRGISWLVVRSVRFLGLDRPRVSEIPDLRNVGG